jgi:NAD(P)-dependent dehydrogenase (short-subunit alcohol dehydrogenase family)
VDALLRDGLLFGLPVAVAGGGAFADAAGRACTELGADVVEDGAAVVVFDGEGALAGADPGVAGVHAALDGAWDFVRPAATASMIPDDRGGKVVLLAPRPGDAHRAAVRSGLENLARTLGIEWARFGIRTVTILPGRATTADEVAQLVAYVASPAGDYFSGCAITLGAVDAHGA